MTTAEAAVRGGERTRIWTRALRVVLVVYAIGHLYTGVLFMGWPGWFIAHIGARPPWPFSVTDLGAWPPLHQGFQNVLAAYDLAVAVALLIAARNPMRNPGIIAFAITLWTLHGGVHAYHILWGTSPSGYWLSVAELWVGAVLLAALYPLARREAYSSPR